MAAWIKDDSDLENGIYSNTFVGQPEQAAENRTTAHEPVMEFVETNVHRRNGKGKKKGRAGRTIALVLGVSLIAASIGGVAGGYAGYYYGGKMAANAQAAGNFTLNTAAPVTANDKDNVSETITPAVTGKQVLTARQIAKKVLPSVVGITTQFESASGFNNPFFDQMPSTPRSGSGSGVIISSDGYIMTNNHVIQDAKTITVVLDNEQSYMAKLIGTDSKTDLAVIKVDATGLTAATLGNSAEMEIGDLALAIGNPLGELAGSVTQGIISALNRNVTIDGQTMNLLQTDAAINPGNSGGALVNQYGEVIGINSAKSSGYDVEGIGFAIPIDDAKPIIEDLVNKGYVTGRPKMGISFREVTEQISQAYSLPRGLYIAQIEEFSAAEKAGLKVGDVITAADGQGITTGDDLTALIKAKKPGDEMQLTVSREGQEKTLTLILQEDKPLSANTQQN